MRNGLIFLLCLVQSLAFANEIKNIRVWAAPDNTRIVLDLADETDYKLFTLDEPHRVVVDVEQAKFSAHLDELTIIDTGIKRIRYGQHKDSTRIVFDIDKETQPSNFVLPPNDTYGHRLVIDLAFTRKSITSLPRVSLTPHTNQFVVAIDPGHGGEDPGAIGSVYSLQEKEVVLAVAKRLKQLIDSQSNMKAILIRTGDYYVGLRKRMSAAREQNADIFISLHADSFHDERANGASVYVLSDRGASSEAARWLAESENRADLMGGVTLEDKGDMLASVLLDLSQTATTHASFDLAESLLDKLKNATKLHQENVQRAGFMVLKSPDVPSVLVELGFISNKRGEQKLRQSKYQQQLAKAIFEGVQHYAKNKPKVIWEPGSIARLQHRVVAGDTLSEIASRYHTSVENLQAANQVAGHEIKVGDTLVIPAI